MECAGLLLSGRVREGVLDLVGVENLIVFLGTDLVIFLAWLGTENLFLSFFF